MTFELRPKLQGGASNTKASQQTEGRANMKVCKGKNKLGVFKEQK